MVEGFQLWIQGIVGFMRPKILFDVLWSTQLGIIVGMLPGLTATMGVALMTTLTFKMETSNAVLILVCMYVGAIYGGSRSAILLNIPGTPANAATAVDGYPLARQGRADAVVKGRLKTDELLSEVLDRHTGVRDKKLLTHVGLFEIPGYDRLIYVSDTGVVLYPSIWQKLEIIRNAVDVAHRLGLAEPKVAILGAFEIVHPKSTASVDALALARMADEGWVKGAVVDGPLALDIAISPASARIKKARTRIAGEADVLIVPSVPAGNIAAKGMLYFGGARMAGLVVGAQVPIIINSRADNAETRLLSMALASVLAASE